MIEKGINLYKEFNQCISSQEVYLTSEGQHDQPFSQRDGDFMGTRISLVFLLYVLEARGRGLAAKREPRGHNWPVGNIR